MNDQKTSSYCSIIELRIPTMKQFWTIGGKGPSSEILHTFMPPDSVEDWPLGVDDVSDTNLLQFLDPLNVGPGAIGSRSIFGNVS
jgi:hypothetical protein